MHQLYYNNSNWSDTDLSTVTGITSSPYDGIDAALAIPGTQHIRLYAKIGQGLIYEFASANNGIWTTSCLCQKANMDVPADLIPNLRAYVTTPNSLIHVFYSAGSHVYQFYQPNLLTWKNQDLTAQTGGDSVDQIFQYFAGFSNQNLQYLYYVGN
jgi:hypothetical protein